MIFLLWGMMREMGWSECEGRARLPHLHIAPCFRVHSRLRGLALGRGPADGDLGVLELTKENGWMDG